MGKFIARGIYLACAIPVSLLVLPVICVIGGIIWVTYNGQKNTKYVGYWAIIKDCPLPPIGGSGKGEYLG